MMNILITGGSGSFGQAFTTFLLQQSEIERIVIVSRDWSRQVEMRKAITDPRIEFITCDICDSERLANAMRGIDTVVHAAGYKHIVWGEYNPFELVRVNIDGSSSVIFSALRAGVKRVIALSSDKACASHNAYGRTKAVMESLITASNTHGQTRFSCVRYGNVINSRGSVIPLWKEQARNNQSLKVTDPRMTRFLMTLNQATQFVWDCLNRMDGGEIFVPKLVSASIGDLAHVVAPDSVFEEIGVRDGEKMHEALIANSEANSVNDCSDCYVISPNQHVVNSLPSDFEYRSDNNPQRLDVGTLKQWLIENGVI